MNSQNNFKQAIILNVSYTGANMALVTIFCQENGLKKGIVKIAKKRQAELQKGNLIEYIHLKRKEDNLGTFKFNLLEQTFIKYFDDLTAIKKLNAICKMLLLFLKEDISQTNVYNMTIRMLKDLNNNEALLSLFKFNLLKEIGYTIDVKDYLKEDKTDTSPAYYVSPKSCRVVSQKLGFKYHNKLLILPFILGGVEKSNQDELVAKINNLILQNMV